MSSNGIMYLSSATGANGTSNGAFYSFPMSALPVNSGPVTAPAVVIAGCGTNPKFNPQQLYFDCNGQVLRAQSYASATRATFDLATGARTRVFTRLIPGTDYGLIDLGGETCTSVASPGSATGWK